MSIEEKKELHTKCHQQNVHKMRKIMRQNFKAVAHKTTNLLSPHRHSVSATSTLNDSH